MTNLNYHEHECPDCEETTVHHKHCHESEGDEVRFWCEHCNADVNGTIGEYVA